VHESETRMVIKMEIKSHKGNKMGKQKLGWRKIVMAGTVRDTIVSMTEIKGKNYLMSSTLSNW